MIPDAHGIFTVNVNIRDVVNCYGYEFTLKFNKTVLNLISATRPADQFLEPLLNPGDYLVPLWKLNESVSGDMQTAHFAYTLLSPESGRNGSGTLVTLTFKAEAYGSTILDLNATMYETIDGYVIVPPLRGDLNLDGKVDIYDIVIIANAFGSTAGDARWNPVADANADGLIDIFDLVIVGGSFGNSL